jgi:dihydrofolate reductase
MTVTLVVGMARNRAIGINNQLPWHLPEDLKHFKQLTTGHCLIMGRKTFDSIGRALPNRRTIVVTRQTNWQHQGCERAASVEAAIEMAKSKPEQKIFVVGGMQIYEQALPMANSVVATEIDIDVAGDAFFPPLNEKQWVSGESEVMTAQNGIKYRVVEYRRRL